MKLRKLCKTQIPYFWENRKNLVWKRGESMIESFTTSFILVSLYQLSHSTISNNLIFLYYFGMRLLWFLFYTINLFSLPVCCVVFLSVVYISVFNVPLWRCALRRFILNSTNKIFSSLNLSFVSRTLMMFSLLIQTGETILFIQATGFYEISWN